MRLDHLHIAITDIGVTVGWFERVLGMRPNYRDGSMAMFPLGDLALLFDKAERATPVTIGFASEDCDEDFDRLVNLGAAVVSAPADQPYGVRSAYLKGPGELTIELEQTLPRAA